MASAFGGEQPKAAQKRVLMEFGNRLGFRTKRHMLSLAMAWQVDEEPTPPAVFACSGSSGVVLDLDRLPPPLLDQIFKVARARMDELNRPAT